MSELIAVLANGSIPIDSPNTYRVVRPNPVNVELLEEEARLVFPPSILWSVDEYKEGSNKYINFGFTAPPTSVQQTQVDDIITNHNPTGQTQAQIKQAEAQQRLLDFQGYFDDVSVTPAETADQFKSLLLHLGLVSE